MSDFPAIHATELVALDALKPHPRNFREHPEAQRRHLIASLEAHGVYRNVVVARDGTLLAGHGVVEAAREAGLVELPVVRLDLDSDDPRALKIVAADNTLALFAVDDDRALAELLSEVRERDTLDGLLGTGYDDAGLAALIRIAESGGEPTRPLDEWAGMPEFEQGDRQSVFHATIHFASEDDVARFFELIGAERRGSFWWPKHDGLVGSSINEAWVAG